jgi:hypothetical protein
MVRLPVVDTGSQQALIQKAINEIVIISLAGSRVCIDIIAKSILVPIQCQVNISGHFFARPKHFTIKLLQQRLN